MCYSGLFNLRSTFSIGLEKGVARILMCITLGGKRKRKKELLHHTKAPEKYERLHYEHIESISSLSW